MRNQAAQRESAVRRLGFTMVELLVVIAIIAVLFGLSFTVMSASLQTAREEATRATIKQLDVALQDRIDDFGRVNFKSRAKQFQEAYRVGGNSSPNPTTITEKVAEAIVRMDRFRSAFPQRVEDLYGFDGVSPTSDDAPLLRLWTNNLTTPANHQPATESIELLVLALTEGAVFGGPSMTLDTFNPNHVKDTDNDGLMEIVDDWGQPLRFYNWPTRLYRPGGGTITPTAFGNAAIQQSYYRASVPVLIPDAPGLTVSTLDADIYSHLLNQDPDDPTGALSAMQDALPPSVDELRTPFNLSAASSQPIDERYYRTLDTSWLPLIVSGGPDTRVGLFEPNGGDPRTPAVIPAVADYPRRLARPLDEDLNLNGALDSGEDLNGNGVLDIALDQLYDNITNRQP